MLKQESTVREYHRVFESLASPLLNLPKHMMDSTFIDGFRSNIHVEVQMFKSNGLSRIMELPQRVEDCNLSLRPGWGSYRTSGSKFQDGYG